MKFNETLPYFFAQFSTSFKVELEKNLVEFDLHSGQIFVLFALWENDGMSQIDLANILNLSPPTINKMVKSLQKNGFVICSPGKSDGRIINVFLSPKAVAIRPQVESIWQKIEEKLTLNLTPTEQLVLNQLLGKIVENFNPDL